MSALHEFKYGVLHFLQSKQRHGVHSPFVYEFMDKVMHLPLPNEAESAIERRRAELKKRDIHFERIDLGAGSRKGVRNASNLAKVVSDAASNAKEARAIANFCKYIRAKKIIELGSNVGIGTSYISSANPEAELHSIEGDPFLSDVAKESIQALVPNHFVTIHTGSFEDELPRLLSHLQEIDVLFIDGNHRKNPTLNYVHWALPFLSDDAAIIVDDIYWSREMTEAWNTICALPNFNLALDFFHFGIIQKTRRKEKEYFKLRL